MLLSTVHTSAAGPFRFTNITDKSVALFDGARPVPVHNHGVMPPPAGAAIFIAPDHPDFPPEWLTPHYGVLCVGWPGVAAQTFPPGKWIRCRSRVCIHRGAPDKAAPERAWTAYTAELQATGKPPKR